VIFNHDLLNSSSDLISISSSELSLLRVPKLIKFESSLFFSPPIETPLAVDALDDGLVFCYEVETLPLITDLSNDA
jgi:hypothetical protein